MNMQTAVLALMVGSTSAYSFGASVNAPCRRAMAARMCEAPAAEAAVEEAEEVAPPPPPPPPAAVLAPVLTDTTWTLSHYGGESVTAEYPTAELLAMGGVSIETADKIWDPLQLASTTNGAFASKLAWYRQAEIKHGRVAMAAVVGWLVSANGITFGEAPLSFSEGVTFASALGSNPLETWDNIPGFGKFQILLLGGVIEVMTEMQKPHYLKGGKFGDVPVPLGWDPLKLAEKKSQGSPAKLAELQAASLQSELKNGRLAMLGIASFYFATVIPGSVPLIGIPDAPISF